MKLLTTISAEYVADWGLFEGIGGARENDSDSKQRKARKR